MRNRLMSHIQILKKNVLLFLNDLNVFFFSNQAMWFQIKITLICVSTEMFDSHYIWDKQLLWESAGVYKQMPFSCLCVSFCFPVASVGTGHCSPPLRYSLITGGGGARQWDPRYRSMNSSTPGRLQLVHTQALGVISVCVCVRTCKPLTTKHAGIVCVCVWWANDLQHPCDTSEYLPVFCQTRRKCVCVCVCNCSRDSVKTNGGPLISVMLQEVVKGGGVVYTMWRGWGGVMVQSVGQVVSGLRGDNGEGLIS